MLERTIGTKLEENASYQTANLLNVTLTTCSLLFALFEASFYLMFHFKTHPWKDMKSNLSDEQLMMYPLKVIM